MNKNLAFVFALIVLITQQIQAQEVSCIFNHYNKKGSAYFFSTFWDVSPSILMNGNCTQYMPSGEIYQKRIFKDGIIQYELTNYINPTRIATLYERVKKDSTIARYTEYAEDGKLRRKTQYYQSKDGRRCWKEEFYFPNGNIHSENSYAALKAEELIGFTSDNIPEHVIDSEGYGYQNIPIGTAITYHNTGKIATYSTYSFNKSALAKYDLGLNGPYQTFSEEGVLMTDGQYLNGRAEGKWTYYFPNGKLSATREFKQDFGVGTWKEYHYNNGALSATETYDDEKYFWPIPHTRRYDENGNLLYEREIMKDGKGFENTFQPNGVTMEAKKFHYGPNEISESFSYYRSGKLKRKSFNRGQNDTLNAEYFEDGNLKTINLTPKNGIGNSKQITANYYSPGKLESQTTYTYLNGITDQHIQKYYENGNFKWELILHEKDQTERDYFSNGKLKCEKIYKNDLLNGNWIEKDSLGNVIRNCFYSEGFKLGKCEKQTQSTIGVAPKEELKVWRAAVINQYMYQFYSTNEQNRVSKFVSKAQINQEAETLWKVVEYCNQNGYTFLPSITTNVEGIISYTFNAPVSPYDPHEKQIDSLLISKGFTLSKKIKQGGYCSFQLTSEDYHSIASFNEILAPFFPLNSGYVNVSYAHAEIDYGLKGNRNFSSFTIERKETVKATIVNLIQYASSKTFTLYDNGTIEFYNGRGDWSAPAPSEYQHMWWD